VLEFYWRVISYGWWVPVKANTPDLEGLFDFSAARLTKDSKGLLLFTSYDSFEKIYPAAAAMQLQLVDGSSVFTQELPGVVEIVLDPGLDHEVTIDDEIFPNIRKLAEAVAIGEVWHRLRVGYPEEPDDISRAARYPSYYIAGIQGEKGVESIEVPHDDGRYFLPVFTHLDALNLALEEFQKSHAPGEVKTVKVGGQDLFPNLVQQKTDGLVFNYKGPGEPIAFDKGIINLMLEELARADDDSTSASPT